jgi:hypothetical protein
MIDLQFFLLDFYHYERNNVCAVTLDVVMQGVHKKKWIKPNIICIEPMCLVVFSSRY